MENDSEAPCLQTMPFLLSFVKPETFLTACLEWTLLKFKSALIKMKGL